MKGKIFAGVLFLIGLIALLLYGTSGKVLFYSYDEISQISDTQIISYADYATQAAYELVLLLVTFISFISSIIMIIKCFFKKKKLKSFQ